MKKLLNYINGDIVNTLKPSFFLLSGINEQESVCL